MICYDDVWVWLLACHVSMTAQQMASCTSHVSVSESSDSEQPTESSDLPCAASSSLPSDSLICLSLIDYLRAPQKPALSVKHIFEHNLTISCA